MDGRNLLLSLPRIVAILTLVLVALPGAAHDIYSTPPNPVFVDTGGRTWQFSNVKLAGQGNVAHVSPGANVSIEFDWTLITGPNPYCPNCLLLFSWGIPGRPICFAAVNGRQPSASKHETETFPAPQAAGVYFVTWFYRMDNQCRGMTHTNEPGAAIGVLIVGQEPWELSQLVNNTQGAVLINTPVLSNETYTNLYALPGLAITMPRLGYITFTPKGHNSPCRSPYWGVEINFQTIQGQQLVWTYYYDVRGELAATLARDGTPTFELPREGQLVAGTARPTCKS